MPRANWGRESDPICEASSDSDPGWRFNDAMPAQLGFSPGDREMTAWASAEHNSLRIVVYTLSGRLGGSKKGANGSRTIRQC